MYSQNREEYFILNHFSDTGHLLDIGANDGKTFSNSLALIERGWKADLYEPHPIAFEKLSLLHKGNNKVKCFNQAVGKKGKSMMHLSINKKDANDIGLVSTLYEGEKTRWIRNPYVDIDWETVEVEVVDPPVKSYDFVTIDVEGSEMDILPYLNYDKTQMVCVEWNSKPEMKKLYDGVLSPKGFHRIIYKNSENIIYVK